MFVVPATVINSRVVDDVEVIENHTVYLTCPADGTPPPSVTWFRDDVPVTSQAGKLRVLSGGRQLEIRHVTVDDEAVYQCRAINVAGQQSKTFTVRVLGKYYITANI